MRWLIALSLLALAAPVSAEENEAEKLYHRLLAESPGSFPALHLMGLMRLQQSRLAEAQRLTSIGSFSWRVAADEITWSDELYRIYEFDPGIKITLEVIRTRVHPEDLKTTYERLSKALG